MLVFGTHGHIYVTAWVCKVNHVYAVVGYSSTSSLKKKIIQFVEFHNILIEF